MLGLFDRILTAWRAAEPGTDDWELIRWALGSVHGVDKNPFAVLIARFRLLVAVLEAAGVKRLDAAPEFPINLAVGDSLIHGRGAPRLRRDNAMLPGLDDEHREFAYSTEDVGDFDDVEMLKLHSYHVVVGNPPYITVKDKGENESYRERYDACSGKYALSVPFAQRFFALALKTGGNDRRAGFVGQITANSFMKREFGKKLIEEFFAGQVHLTHIIDASGAYIPGHGTPTVILVGRNHLARLREPIHAVLGVRGEPDQPEDAADGRVWKAILDAVLGSRRGSEWVSVEEADRASFARHPWSVAGGGAGDLKELVEAQAARRLGDLVESTGFAAITGEDDVFVAGERLPARWVRHDCPSRVFVEGERVRDYKVDASTVAVYPYGATAVSSCFEIVLWPWRQRLRSGLAFGQTREDREMNWWEYILPNPKRLNADALIAFAFVATHNHFVLDRGGKVFKQPAPVIKRK